MRPRALSTSPYFVVSDLQRSIDFYQKLGYAEPFTWGDPPCFAMLNRDGFDLMLSLAESPDAIRPNGPRGLWDQAIRIADIPAEIAALQHAGVAIDKGPRITEYEMTEIEVVDPDGYRTCIGQSND